MKDENKTKAQLIDELQEIRRRVSELEKTEPLCKQAEDVLQESEQMIRVLLNATTDEFMLFNPDGAFVAVNESAAKGYGLTPEELIGKYPFDFMPPEVSERRRKLYKEIVAGKKHVQFEDENQGRYYNNSVFPILDDNGKLQLVAVFANDITERKQAEDALIKERNRANSILEGTNAGTWDWNVQTGEVTVNERWAEIMGRTLQEMEPIDIQTWINNIHPDDLPNANAQLEQHFTGKQDYYDVEFRQPNKNGGWVWVNARGKVVERTEDGKPLRMSGTHLDITERKQAEEKLKESEEYFRELIENASDVISILDEQGKIIYESPSQKRVLGYNTGYLIGKNAFEYIHPDDRERISLQFAGLLQKPGEIEKVYFHFLHKNGSWLHIEGAGRNLLKSTSINGIVVNYRDVTVHMQMEEEKAKLEVQLRRSQKLETIGTLAGGIAHDFNNILAPIMGYTDMALLKSKETDPVYKDLQHVLTAARRAKDLVEQILLFSKQTEKERQPLKMQKLVKEALKLLRPSIPSTIEIRQRIDSSCAKIQGDATQIHQVIVNLCTNAWQAMEEKGGILTIKLKQVIVNASTAKLYPNLNEADYACLSVIDTGCGMDEETLDRIFEPFFTTKALNKGTGLGLSVVHGIIRSHQGDILVYSEPGKGTEFNVYLPTVTAEAETVEAKSNVIEEGSEYIMIVDDEPAIAKMVKEMLENFGYKAEVYYSGLAAIKVFKQKPDKYDLLISDLTMPQMTGLDLADQLHKEDPEFPVLIMTGFGDSLTAAMLKRYSIKQVIGKPVSVKELATAVRKVLDK